MIMLTYSLTDIFSIMFDKNLNMTTFKCFGNVMYLQGYLRFYTRGYIFELTSDLFHSRNGLLDILKATESSITYACCLTNLARFILL